MLSTDSYRLDFCNLALSGFRFAGPRLRASIRPKLSAGI
jgi:hypothetical protein